VQATDVEPRIPRIYPWGVSTECLEEVLLNSRIFPQAEQFPDKLSERVLYKSSEDYYDRFIRRQLSDPTVHVKYEKEPDIPCIYGSCASCPKGRVILAQVGNIPKCSLFSLYDKQDVILRGIDR
jgi:hypothetical protein